MVNNADVFLWGKQVGSISQEDNGLMNFRYTDWAIDNKVNLSPILMPAERRTYQFPDLLRTSFKGVPGLISDSLPEKFGNAVINNWLTKQGKNPEKINAVERLCYTANRGMGALEYKPQLGSGFDNNDKVDVDALVELATSVLIQRKNFLVKSSEDEDLATLLKLGTSAGGARAKAIVAWNKKTGEIKSGQINAGDGFEYWIIKLDGVDENGDKEDKDEAGFGKIEYAYYLMAQDCGIEMMDCHLYKENGRSHFMTKRFDRKDDGEKLHMQTLAALTHSDYNYPGTYSYEEACNVIRKLTNDKSQVEKQFKRMIFNILGVNQDDHVKNISFLMDKNLEWKLSPAYDNGFAYNPGGAYTCSHQMTVNGKQSEITIEDIVACGNNIGLTNNKIKKNIEAVTESVRKWESFAEMAEVPEKKMEAINNAIRKVLDK